MGILWVEAHKILIQPSLQLSDMFPETRRKGQHTGRVLRISRPSRYLPPHTIGTYRIPGKIPGEVDSYKNHKKWLQSM